MPDVCLGEVAPDVAEAVWQALRVAIDSGELGEGEYPKVLRVKQQLALRIGQESRDG